MSSEETRSRNFERISVVSASLWRHNEEGLPPEYQKPRDEYDCCAADAIRALDAYDRTRRDGNSTSMVQYKDGQGRPAYRDDNQSHSSG